MLRERVAIFILSVVTVASAAAINDDPCVPNPCVGGICERQTGGQYSCHCMEGYWGSDCQYQKTDVPTEIVIPPYMLASQQQNVPVVNQAKSVQGGPHAHAPTEEATKTVARPVPLWFQLGVPLHLTQFPGADYRRAEFYDPNKPLTVKVDSGPKQPPYFGGNIGLDPVGKVYNPYNAPPLSYGAGKGVSLADFAGFGQPGIGDVFQDSNCKLPCQNGGFCNDFDLVQVCVCPLNYGGIICQINKDLGYATESAVGPLRVAAEAAVREARSRGRGRRRG